MKKPILIGIVAAGVLLLGAIGSTANQPAKSQLESVQPKATNTQTKAVPQRVEPVCDGTAVKSDCSIEGVRYSTYIYHPAVTEVSHNETVTTYKQEVTGYCTRCNDGSYSPSCATGRGACSHHGGVAEWNAPRYANVPQYSTKKVVDTPAREAYYEKVTK